MKWLTRFKAELTPTPTDPALGWQMVTFFDESGEILLSKAVRTADVWQATQLGVTHEGTLPYCPPGTSFLGWTRFAGVITTRPDPLG